MSTTRALVLLVVLVGVLFAVSLALGHRNGDAPVNPTNSWLARLTRPQPFDLSEISSTNGWHDGRWTIARGVREAGLEIAPSRSHRVVRQLKISLQGQSAFQLQFTPQSEQGHPDQFADADATVLKVKKLKPGQKNVQLTILEHGGRLVVHRTSATTPAVFTLQ